jgi:hypothetical protein
VQVPVTVKLSVVKPLVVEELGAHASAFAFGEDVIAVNVETIKIWIK